METTLNIQEIITQETFQDAFPYMNYEEFKRRPPHLQKVFLELPWNAAAVAELQTSSH